jgi:hypothetical protein
MISTLTNTHRLGHQPGHARVDGAIGQAWQGRPNDQRPNDQRPNDLGLSAARRSASWTYVARQANATGAPAVSAFDGILAVPTMWTKSATRHLAPRST